MRTRMWRWAALLGTGAMVFGGLGGGCLPEDFWVNKVGEIANGLIIAGVNTALGSAGLPTI